jgi:hypothetical protein
MYITISDIFMEICLNLAAKMVKGILFSLKSFLSKCIKSIIRNPASAFHSNENESNIDRDPQIYHSNWLPLRRAKREQVVGMTVQ